MNDDQPNYFFDTNVLLYLLSDDQVKANRAEEVIAVGGIISVQVLNEFANVTRNKLQMEWDDILTILGDLRGFLSVVDLTQAVHDSGCKLARQYKLSIYDSFIVAAAIDADCTVLMSEDMHNGLLVCESLRIENPFA